MRTPESLYIPVLSNKERMNKHTILSSVLCLSLFTNNVQWLINNNL
jgi:hypothetical protein